MATSANEGKPLAVRWLGRRRFADTLDLQQRLVRELRDGTLPDTLLWVEHDPVITLGRRADPAHVLLDAAELARRGIERFEIGRGGDATYHGPGQLVGYPLLRLSGSRRDAHRYLRDLEQVLIDTVAAWGIRAHRAEGLTGVWVGQEKLAAIGIRLNTGWITSHGFALNVTNDLSGFDTIVPCGIRGRGVTSIARLSGKAPELPEVACRITERLARAFDLRSVPAETAGERLPGGV